MRIRGIKRVELKEMVKDLQEQIVSGVEVEELYLKGFITYGDGSYEGVSPITFDGRVTRNESNGYKVKNTDDLIITAYEDGSIEVSVLCTLEDEDQYTHKDWITLNI